MILSDQIDLVDMVNDARNITFDLNGNWHVHICKGIIFSSHIIFWWPGSTDWDYSRVSSFTFFSSSEKDCGGRWVHESWQIWRMASTFVCNCLISITFYFLCRLRSITKLIVYSRFVGNLLKGQTVGVIGAGRIGSAYARMMVIISY